MSFMRCAPHRWSFEPAGPHLTPHSCVAICVVCGTQIAFRRRCLKSLPNTIHTICTVPTTQMEHGPHHFVELMLSFAWCTPHRSRSKFHLCGEHRTDSMLHFLNIFVRGARHAICAVCTTQLAAQVLTKCWISKLLEGASVW